MNANVNGWAQPPNIHEEPHNKMLLPSITVGSSRSHACKCLVISLITHGFDVLCVYEGLQLLSIGIHLQSTAILQNRWNTTKRKTSSSFSEWNRHSSKVVAIGLNPWLGLCWGISKHTNVQLILLYGCRTIPYLSLENSIQLHSKPCAVAKSSCEILHYSWVKSFM